MSIESGGAGSGYIGNSLLSNKKMVGYNVPTSSAEGTYTESVNDVSASAVSGKPKSGNGFAKIKFLRDLSWKQIELPTNNQVVLKPSDNSDWQLQNIPEQIKAPYMYQNDLIIVTGQSNCVNLQKNDDFYTYPYNDVVNFNSRYYYYLGDMKKHIISGKVKYRNTSGNHFPRLEVRLYNSYTLAMPAIISISSGTTSQDFIDGEKIFDSEIEADYLLIRGALDSFDFKNIEILCD